MRHFSFMRFCFDSAALKAQQFFRIAEADFHALLIGKGNVLDKD